MGGMYVDALAQGVTHLVTESVRTKKYEVSIAHAFSRSEHSFILICISFAK